MRTTLTTLICLAAFPADGQSDTQQVRFVASRQVVLSIQAAEDERVCRAFVWASTDGRRTWQELPAGQVAPTALRVNVQADAHFEFYVVLENEAGRSGPAPSRGTEPHASVVVDTTPPTLQASGLGCETTPAGRRLGIRCTLIEEHLREQEVRLFYQLREDAGWTDGGGIIVTSGQAFWPVPDELTGPARIRLVATDLAGNRAASEFDAHFEPKPLPKPAGGEAAPLQPPKSVVQQPRPDVNAHSPEADKQPPASQPALSPQALALLEQARRFQQRGQYALAAARLRQAVAESPGNPDLLASLGNALLRIREVDQADAAFREAIEHQRDHRAALEGLALAAVAKNQYPDARRHLRRLLELEPEAPRLWLHYGDVEHRLGEKQPALDAWHKVLTLEKKSDSELSGRAQRRLDLLSATHSAPGTNVLPGK